MAIKVMPFDTPQGTKPMFITKAEATKLRAQLRDEGFDQDSGWGRGTSWTRHFKGSALVFVHKIYFGEDTGKFYARGDYQPK